MACKKLCKQGRVKAKVSTYWQSPIPTSWS